MISNEPLFVFIYTLASLFAEIHDVFDLDHNQLSQQQQTVDYISLESFLTNCTCLSVAK